MKIQLPPNGQVTVEFEGHTTVLTIHFDKKNDRLTVQSDLLGTVYDESLEASILIVDKEEALRTKVSELPFCSRAQNFFDKNDIVLVRDLVQYSKRQLLSYPHMGVTTVEEIQRVLRRMYLALK